MSQPVPALLATAQQITAIREEVEAGLAVEREEDPGSAWAGWAEEALAFLDRVQPEVAALLPSWAVQRVLTSATEDWPDSGIILVEAPR